MRSKSELGRGNWWFKFTIENRKNVATDSGDTGFEIVAIQVEIEHFMIVSDSLETRLIDTRFVPDGFWLSRASTHDDVAFIDGLS